MKLNSLKFATAAGIIVAISFAWITIASLVKIPGFLPFANILEQGFGFYGYSISWLGALLGAFYGFIEGFIWIGALAWVYNMLVK